VNSFYWDASALAKRYAPEIGTPLVNHLFTYVTPDRMLCLIVGVSEVISIFVRKKNARLITPEAFSQALVDFRTEIIEVDAFKLGRVDELFDANPHGNEMDQSQKGLAQFLIPRGDTSKLFEIVEEPFYLLTELVEVFIIV
jgi:hypothetical protein